jgi:putative redox protein
MKEVIVRGGTAFKTEISAGPHTFYADEPADAGGTEAGPTPYDFLSAALGACTSMTVHVVAKRENIPLEGIELTITNDRMHAQDCADCTNKAGYIHRFTVKMRLSGNLTPQQKQRIVDVARRCPVLKTLQSEIKVDETLVEEES